MRRVMTPFKGVLKIMELTTRITSGDNSYVKSLTPRAMTHSTYYFIRRRKIDNRNLNIKELDKIR